VELDRNSILVGLFFVIACMAVFWVAYEYWRSHKVKGVSKSLGFKFTTFSKLENINHPVTHLFELGERKYFTNVMEGVHLGKDVFIAGYNYHIGNGKSRRRICQTIFIFNIFPKELPYFEAIAVKGKFNPFFLLEKVPQELDIKLGFEDFDAEYLVRGKDVKRIRRILNPLCTRLLTQYPGVSIEQQGGLLMFYVSRHRVKPSELKSNLDGYSELCASFVKT